MPHDIVNGGIIASVIDCHGVCTAIADAYKQGGSIRWRWSTPVVVVRHRVIARQLFEADAALSMPFTVRARVTDVDRRRTSLAVELVSDDGTLTCTGEVVAAQVSDRWARDQGYYAYTS